MFDNKLNIYHIVYFMQFFEVYQQNSNYTNNIYIFIWFIIKFVFFRKRVQLNRLDLSQINWTELNWIHSVSIIPLRLPNDTYVNTDMSPHGKPLRISYKFFYSQLTITPTIYLTGPLWMSAWDLIVLSELWEMEFDVIPPSTKKFRGQLKLMHFFRCLIDWCYLL